MLKVKLLPEAESHIRMHLKAGNKNAYKKIQDFLKELKEHPTTGTVQPQQLKHVFWVIGADASTKKRLIYRIEEEIVTVEVVLATTRVEILKEG